MKVGRGTYGQEHIKIHNNSEQKYDLYIGNFCSIASNVTVYLGGHHNYRFMTTYPFGLQYKHLNSVDGYNCVYYNGDVIIENDVWVGMNSTIMAGVKIKNGAIIAANSHVVKDVAPYSIVGGNPASHIKYRFDQKVIEKLQEIKWWDMNDEDLNAILPILCSNDYNKLFNI